jgi:7-carboxy-7-deazaguanine synthase
LAGCPVGCPWCNTGYSDSGASLPRQIRSIGSLIDELKKSSAKTIVISGGEPFIHKNLPLLCEAIKEADRSVHIETSGSFYQPVEGVWVTLSPKEHVNPRYPVLPEMWALANEVKIVVSSGNEIDFYLDKLRSIQCPVFIQPEWNNEKSNIKLILDLLSRFPEFRLSVQLHKHIGLA